MCLDLFYFVVITIFVVHYLFSSREQKRNRDKIILELRSKIRILERASIFGLSRYETNFLKFLAQSQNNGDSATFARFWKEAPPRAQDAFLEWKEKDAIYFKI